MMIRRAAWLFPTLAISTFRPSTRPVTTPSMRPLARTANAVRTSRPFNWTRSALASCPFGSTISTYASPPLIRSARLDRVLIRSPRPSSLSSESSRSASCWTRGDRKVEVEDCSVELEEPPQAWIASALMQAAPAVPIRNGHRARAVMDGSDHRTAGSGVRAGSVTDEVQAGTLAWEKGAFLTPCGAGVDTPARRRLTRFIVAGRSSAVASESGRAGHAGAADPAVAARILRQVLLVVVLGVIERRLVGDLGGDLAVAGFRERALVLFA